MMSFRVCTYNMGSNRNDYLMLCVYLDPRFKFESQEHERSFDQEYFQAQIKVAELLVNQAEIYLLQEVCEEGRPLIQELRKRGFQIVKFNKTNFDCAIMVSRDFEVSYNGSAMLNGGDVAMATATHLPTGETVTLLSAHVPPCSLDGEVDKLDAATGDKYCAEIAELLDKVGHSTFQVLGFDMNANPEKWAPRFTPFHERKFQLVRTNAPTNIMPRSQVYIERELDFLFFRFSQASLGRRFMNLLNRTSGNRIELLSQPLGWKKDQNASDHLPIFAKCIF